MIVLGTKRFDGIPAAAAAAISQMSSTVARLGGRLYWSPSAAIGPSTFVNSDGSGGATPISGLVGLELDQSGGWGFAGPELITTPVESSIAGWTLTGAVTTSFVGGALRIASSPGNGGVFRDFAVTPNQPISALFRVDQIAGSGGAFTLFDGAGFGTSLFNSTPTAGNLSAIVTPATGILRVYFFVNTAGTADFSRVSVRAISSTVANALTQATTANKPLLVPGAVPWANALSFAGDDLLTNAAQVFPTTGGYYAAALNCSNTTPTQVLLEAVPATPNDSMQVTISGGTVGVYRAGGSALATRAFASSTPSIVEAGIASGTAFIAVDGAETTGAFAAFTAATGANYFGRAVSLFYSGTCAGLVISPNAANAAERAIIRRGLGFLAGTVTA